MTQIPPTDTKGNRPFSKARYGQMVGLLVPGTPEDQIEIRAALMMMRDLSSSAKRNAGDVSWAILDIIEQVVTQFGFAAMTTEEATEMRMVLRLLAQAAARFDSHRLTQKDPGNGQ